MIPNERLLPIPTLEKKVGLKRSKIYALISSGDMPPGKVIHGTLLWRESDIDAWIERVWSSTEPPQESGVQKPPSNTKVKVEPPADTAVALSPLPVSAYWTSSYLRERYGVSRTTLHRWINTKGFPAPSLPGESTMRSVKVATPI